MFMLGFALLGSTLLLPLFLQTLLGYTAQLSGMALSPGGFAIMVLMPLVGWLLSKYDARYLLLFGLSMLSFSLFHMTNFNLDIDFKTAVWARVLQAVGLAFLFVPINTAAYAYLPREKNNAASGLMNLARNIGGSVGISFVTTLLDRRTQKHVSDLMSHLTSAAAPESPSSWRSACTGSSGITCLRRRSPNRRMSIAERWNSGKRRSIALFTGSRKYSGGEVTSTACLWLNRRPSTRTVW